MRLFVAIDATDEAANYCRDLQVQLLDGPWKSTRVKQFHCTIQFLGECKSSDAVAAALAGVSMPRFLCETGPIGIFSHPNHAKVVWVSLRAGHHFQILSQKIGNALKPLGFLKSENQPHMTVLRLKSLFDEATFAQKMLQLKPKTVSFLVNSFVLYESILRSEGPMYRAIERFDLDP